MRIKELIERKDAMDVTCTKANKTLLDVAYTQMKNKIGALVVLDEKKQLAGIVSERDIVKALATLVTSFHLDLFATQ